MAEDGKGDFMTTFATLYAQKRNVTGKGACRRLRAAGSIPAVFYTPGGENIPLHIAEAPLMKLFQTLGRTTVFTLEIDDNGKKITAPALLWDMERYPTKNRLQHVDIFGVDLEKEIAIRVPLEFVGTAKGAKLGGELRAYYEHMDVFCKPLNLPKKIAVDVAGLEIGQSIHVADMVMPEGVRPGMDPAVAIVSVTVAASEGEDAGADAAEKTAAP